MKYIYSLILKLICITPFFHHLLSAELPSPDDYSGCVLNFTAYPYNPSGDCLVDTKKVMYWGSIPSYLCCRNTLTVFSQTLALHAKNTDGKVFLKKDSWTKCSGSFRRQKSVSLTSCGLDDFFLGNSMCSGYPLERYQEDNTYRDALKLCSELNPFGDACKRCSNAISRARDYRLGQDVKTKHNYTEKEICGFGVVTAVAAELLRDPSSTDDFYRCLSAMDVLEPGYFKLKNSTAKAIFAIVIAIIVLMLILALIRYVNKKSKKNKGLKKRNNLIEETTKWYGLYRFTKSEVENAINFYEEKQKLGKGSAGNVYKGVLPSGQVVAIKHMNKNGSSDSFAREVDRLSRIRHPSLVCLFGCCVEGGEQYLVYEYCSEGNLAQHLLRKDCELTWEIRVKILRDCGLALRFLHHNFEGCIVHRDIKLTNILLTEKLDPKLSDFGLAKMMGVEESKVFTDVRGTIGYMDPEYMSNAKLTCSSDIYSFGIVVLQILSGQKVIELDLDARDQLTRKAKDASMGKRPLTDFEDPRLLGDLNREDFASLLHIAVLCVARSSKVRPTIDVVYDEIEKAWKNIETQKKAKKGVSSSPTPTPTPTPMSMSFDLLPL